MSVFGVRKKCTAQNKRMLRDPCWPGWCVVHNFLLGNLRVQSVHVLTMINLKQRKVEDGWSRQLLALFQPWTDALFLYLDIFHWGPGKTGLQSGKKTKLSFNRWGKREQISLGGLCGGGSKCHGTVTHFTVDVNTGTPPNTLYASCGLLNLSP